MKKISPLNKLRRENKELKTLLASAQTNASHWHSKWQQSQLEFEEYKKKPLSVDRQMIAERIKLAANIGQLTEAVSKAIMVVVGKEVM